jgi:hypothetical protein
VPTLTPDVEFDRLTKIPRRDRTEEQNARVRELAALLVPQPEPPAKRSPAAKVRYAINTEAQAERAIKAAYQTTKDDQGEELAEAGYTDIVRAVLYDAKPSVRDEMLRREGLLGWFE